MDVEESEAGGVTKDDDLASRPGPRQRTDRYLRVLRARIVPILAARA